MPVAQADERQAAAELAALAEKRFLDTVRRRVAWQAGEAARQRAVRLDQAPAPDLLDVAVLARLLETRPDAPRAAEWRVFVAELQEIADAEGRLPAVIERLVRFVLADLL